MPMTPQELLDALRSQEEPKGYFFHADKEHCLSTAASLLDSMEHYGYYCCPCRLPSGNKDADADISCPCDYREEDVAEFGACYCSLFVSEEHKDDHDFFPEVEERRPPEKSV